MQAAPEFSEMRSQQLRQIGDHGPVPGNAENVTFGIYVFAYDSAVAAPHLSAFCTAPCPTPLFGVAFESRLIGGHGFLRVVLAPPSLGRARAKNAGKMRE